ncbi:MAG: carboxypeptidase-like regulatory domain-containing protein [Panacibacter sp.]
MKHFVQRLFLLAAILVSALNVAAQKKTIAGFVTDSISNDPLKNVQVTNVTGNKKTTTDNNGKFSIDATVNDMLFFTADGYHFKNVKYSILMEQTIYVQMNVLPHQLPGVSVQASYSKYQSDSLKRLQDFNADMVSPKQPLVSNNSSGAGAVINLDFLKKSEKSKRRASKLFKAHEKDAYVRYRFPPELVSGYTGLNGDSLEKFINLYWPDYDWLRKHTSDEDVFYYINDKLKIFYKRKEEQ